MISVFAVMVAWAIAWCQAGRARRRLITQIEAEHERAIEFAVRTTSAAYQAAIDDLTTRFTLRLIQIEAERRLAQRLDIIESSDVGLYEHPSGEVSPIEGVGRC